ncbi:MAG: DUF5320 domain-containing protein [Spirochaetales bacterium]|nr:DUF5320 domain-containing protein [Spirochaetales bacterium]
MPMRDGRGPAGYGPLTGHGAGYCNGFNRPGSFQSGGRGFGRGNGFGRMNGMGRQAGGYRGMNFPPMGIQRISDEEYKNMLSEEAEHLEKRLAEIKTQLSPENGDVV